MYVCTYVCVYMYVCMYVCMYMYIYTCMYVCICICIRVSVLISDISLQELSGATLVTQAAVEEFLGRWRKQREAMRQDPLEVYNMEQLPVGRSSCVYVCACDLLIGSAAVTKTPSYVYAVSQPVYLQQFSHDLRSWDIISIQDRGVVSHTRV